MFNKFYEMPNPIGKKQYFTKLKMQYPYLMINTLTEG